MYRNWILVIAESRTPMISRVKRGVGDLVITDSMTCIQEIKHIDIII